MPFIITSNIFLLLPVLVALWKGEWVYFTCAILLFIISPSFHYLYEHGKRGEIYRVTRYSDWILAVVSYAYMFYFVFIKVPENLEVILGSLLVLTVAFFFYGYKFGNYKKMHPWFHIVAPILSAFIVYIAR